MLTFNDSPPLGLETWPVLPPALDHPFSQGFPRNQSEIQWKENDSRSPGASTPGRSNKKAFKALLICRQKRITEKGRPKLNSLTKASKDCVRHVKDCNYECYEWLTANTEHKLFCWLCLLFNPSKVECFIIWWVLYHAHCYGGVRGALIILCCVWMSSVCTVLLLWARRHFRET